MRYARSMTNHFPLLGEPLAVDLANTVVAKGGTLSDRLVTDADVVAWLASHRDVIPSDAPSSPLATMDLRALRDAIRELLHAAVNGNEPDHQALRSINGAARDSPVPALEWTPEGFTLAAEGAASSENALLAVLARSAVETLTGEDAACLRACAGEGCVLVFVATHPRRKFCSPNLCGARTRVARHRERQRASARQEAQSTT